MSKATSVGGLFHSAKYLTSPQRKQAEECRDQAAKAVSPLDKEAWLGVAGEWIKLEPRKDAEGKAASATLISVNA